MNGLQVLKSALAGGASMLTLVNPAAAKVFDIPGGDLAAALNSYMRQSGVEIIYLNDVVRGHKSRGAKGDYTETAALDQILRGTGFTTLTTSSNAIDIVPTFAAPKPREETIRVAAAALRAPVPGAIETVVVTAQHKSENIQNVPIAVTALSQQQLTERQIAGGPDLLRDVPNMNFGKTNFTGYSIELRGIGTQAISVTTDPAVAVAFNDIPFIRNHFFEQEFYDLSDVEVLRGPQGTLYGRNATAGVVNLKSALPTDSFEAMLSADLGNYSNRRLEAMLNLPIVGDKLDIRMAAEWTKRNGYSFDDITNQPIDGRDLWSGRLTIGWKPSSDSQIYLVWEHFSEDDNRLRSGKQLCKTATVPAEIDGTPVEDGGGGELSAFFASHYLDQGCDPTSLYSPSAFGVPDGNTLAYYAPLVALEVPLQGSTTGSFDPYASTVQSQNLRVIQSQINPIYHAKNDTVELNAQYNLTPGLIFTSQTGFNHDFLWSAEDYNRFETAPGIFAYSDPSIPGGNNDLNQLTPDPLAGTGNIPTNAGVFCDPQLGCSDRLVAEDLSDEHAWQLSQEFRLASNFGGPFNFSVGGNYLHYETEENYYVFINTLTLTAASPTFLSGDVPWVPGVTDNHQCLRGGFANSNPHRPSEIQNESGCIYIDPNSLEGVNNEGHNYFLSQNPYLLNSYAAFGEAYYNISNDLKLTTGLRWTDDQKHFIDIPSELLVRGYGYASTGVVDQQWNQFTGRAALDWTPKLDFTDETLLYASYGHGYKAGGANPPGAVLLSNHDIGDITDPIHPLTFKPEFIEAFEFGTKNTLLDNTLTLDGDIFYYNYSGYQISEIVDRTAINNNYNAHVEGAEIESNWEPLQGLKFNFAGGWEDTAAAGGDAGIDLMDRTAGTPGWIVVKPFVTQASNCILPDYLVAAMLQTQSSPNFNLGQSVPFGCDTAYNAHLDPITRLPYVANPTQTNAGEGDIPAGYPGFNPATAPNNGEGFSKNLSGHQLPNAPPFTVSFGAQYTIPVMENWAATLRGDYYWQDESWARIFNDNPYDKLYGYTNVNLALILTSDDGWQVMGYVKNVFNVTAITGDFLNSDDSALTTNVFLTDPRLYGVRVTRNFGEGDTGAMGEIEGYIADFFADAGKTKPNLWITFGGQLEQMDDAQQPFAPSFVLATPRPKPETISPLNIEYPPRDSIGGEGRISFEPEDSDWVISASIVYGRTNSTKHVHQQSYPAYKEHLLAPPLYTAIVTKNIYASGAQFIDTKVKNTESHAIVDFQAGKDVGLGMFGGKGSSVFSLGVRFAQFTSDSNIALKSDPDFKMGYLSFGRVKIPQPKPFHSYVAALSAKKSFHGVGPSISWNASAPVIGNEQNAEIALDWGANASLLFGRQRAKINHQSTTLNQVGGNGYFPPTAIYHTPVQHARARAITVPNIGGFAGVSWQYQNAKVSFGYRGDFFFSAMDGGIDTRKSENVGFFGPYANISLGLGG